MTGDNQWTEFQKVCIHRGEICFYIAKWYFRSCKHTRGSE